MDPLDLPIDRYLNLVAHWIMSVLRKDLGIDRQTVEQWLTPAAPAAITDGSAWSAEAEMEAFREAQAGGL